MLQAESHFAFTVSLYSVDIALEGIDAAKNAAWGANVFTCTLLNSI